MAAIKSGHMVGKEKGFGCKLAIESFRNAAQGSGAVQSRTPVML